MRAARKPTTLTVAEMVARLSETPDGRAMLRAIWQRLGIAPEEAHDHDSADYRTWLKRAVEALP